MVPSLTNRGTYFSLPLFLLLPYKLAMGVWWSWVCRTHPWTVTRSILPPSRGMGNCNPTSKMSAVRVPAHPDLVFCGQRAKENPTSQVTRMNVVNLLTGLASLQDLESSRRSSQWALNEPCAVALLSGPAWV